VNDPDPLGVHRSPLFRRVFFVEPGPDDSPNLEDPSCRVSSLRSASLHLVGSVSDDDAAFAIIVWLQRVPLPLLVYELLDGLLRFLTEQQIRFESDSFAARMTENAVLGTPPIGSKH